MGMYLPSSRPMIRPITVPTIASPKEENFTPGRSAPVTAPKVAQRMASVLLSGFNYCSEVVWSG